MLVLGEFWKVRKEVSEATFFRSCPSFQVTYATRRFGEDLMKTLYTLLVAAITAAFLLAACAAPPTQVPPTQVPPTEAPTVVADLLSTILARGTLVVSTDPAYPPQSALKVNPQRTAATKCTSDQKTLGELEGFDIDVAAAIAKGLGVEPCFVSPEWGLIIAGGWAGGWDISVGSMTITAQRAKVLDFAQPYYITPADLFVHKTNTTYSKPSDLDGKKIGVAGASTYTSTTYQSYFDGTLEIPGEQIDLAIKNAQIKTYDSESLALGALALGDGAPLDAVLTAQTMGIQAIDSGKPIKQMGDPLYFEYLAPAIDRQSTLDPHSFVAKVSEIITGLHKDGTLLKLSQQWYKMDLTTAAASFDASALGK
jgi:polar amino acid transport system substrate-binding protein